MKLNYKKTLLIGLAFMSICAFWQLYDGLIPLILRDTFHFGDTFAGVIMALDNVIALFLLPILGALSDKVDTKIGKRMPFILGGTAVAVVAMTFLPVVDNAYAASGTVALRYVFIGILLVVLLAMASYRSPAVALMPDLTVKPLRSKANAVINLMGAVGGILYLILSTFMYSKSKTEGLSHINYLPIFLIIASIMAVSVVVLFFTIKEKKEILEVEAYDREHPEEDLSVQDEAAGKTVLPPDVKKSLAFILGSIALWFMGYNAITTAFTKYATKEWSMAPGGASLCLTIATAGAIVSYLPIGMIASRVGRKRTIMTGIILLASCFALGGVYTIFADTFSPILYVLFVLIGFAWAAINVNSLPMVVEMCRGSDVGKFTGLYYTFSMSAQILTPILSGFLLEKVGYWTLFPYGALFVALSFVTMIFVRHGDSRPDAKQATMEAIAASDD
ncbi:MAG: MFS transporter [Ruminococcus sp.]|nr:MFS transporter [Candidatus Apopatosoma intestinale]